MPSSAIVLNSTTLTNPHGASSDFCVYALDLFGTQLYAGGWLDGNIGNAANPDGWGLDRIYVSSGPMLDDFAAVVWTDNRAPGTFDDPATSTLYDETFDAATGSYGYHAYYGPANALGGSIYYQVNDPTVVAEAGKLVMFMTAVPSRNEFPSLVAQPNGNPNYQLGWLGIGWALSADNGATWTWEGMVPMLGPDMQPLLAPVTLPFPTDPAARYDLSTAGNGYPSALNVGADLHLWYTHRDNGGDIAVEGTPSTWLSREDSHGTWAAPAECFLVTAAGSIAMALVNVDVEAATDGSGALWMVAQQWHGPQSGDIKLFYSSPADGAGLGTAWHPWDGVDGILVVTDSFDAQLGLYNLVTPTILGVGAGKVSIAYAVPSLITPEHLPTQFDQIAASFAVPNPTVACFGQGTRLLTANGEVAVEHLRVGDLLATTSGARLAPVRWIGHRHVDLRHHPRPWDVAPVRVQAGAFALGQPHRDLLLSPDHAVLVGGVLIPIRHLLNGATIHQLGAGQHRGAVDYWHVELDRHSVLLAEGMAAESYLDTGNRAAFADGGPATRLHPDFAAAAWVRHGCAPLVLGGDRLVAARQAVRARAGLLGHATTPDPDLRAIFADREFRPEVGGRRHRFHLPPSGGIVRLLSRSMRPAEMRDDATDHRRLGIALGAIACAGQGIALDDPRLLDGWHPAEQRAADHWRWTAGDATITVPGGILDVEVTMTGQYWREPEPAVFRATA